MKAIKCLGVQEIKNLLGELEKNAPAYAVKAVKEELDKLSRIHEYDLEYSVSL